MKKEEMVKEIKELCAAITSQVAVIREIKFELVKQDRKWQAGTDAAWWNLGDKSFEVYKVATTAWRQKSTKLDDLQEIIAAGYKAIERAKEIESEGWELLGY